MNVITTLICDVTLCTLVDGSWTWRHVGGNVDATPCLAYRTTYVTKPHWEKFLELIQRIFFIVAAIKIATLIYCYNSIIIYNIIQNIGRL